MRKKITFILALSLLAGTVSSSYVYAEDFNDTDNAEIVVYPDKINKKVSPFIYGINDVNDIDGASATVLKQTGYELSSYNWETNYSNTSTDGTSSNGLLSFVEDFTESDLINTPALYTDNLITHAFMNNIPVRLVTLQMMGYVANDAMGAVTEKGVSDRWAQISFSKGNSYLNVPDTTDNTVYIDEYAAYLVNKYGTVEEGGINGFFLDSEPEKWSENYPVLELSDIDAAELIEKSASLSSAVKIIDENALIFAPSVSTVSAYADLNGTFQSDSESFADYYLSGMQSRSEDAGKRLLDVFDIHLEEVTGNSINGIYLSEDGFRMQSTSLLIDEDYSDDTDEYSEYEDFYPVIPTLTESIEKNYPGTKLSFSEYSFGGGDNMSGCIAEVDALGIFGQNGVYLACLYPDEISEYQKSGLNLYRNYDYMDSQVGNISVAATNTDDEMSSVYAFTDEYDESKLWVIVTNKNEYTDKEYTVSVSGEKTYSLSEMYTISDNSSEIVKSEELPVEETIMLSPESVSLFVYETEDTQDSSDTNEEEEITDTETETQTETEKTNPEEKTIEIVTESVTESQTETDSEEITTALETENTSETTPENSYEDTKKTEISNPSENEETEEKEFPFVLKIIASLATICTLGGIVYVIFSGKR